MCRRVCVCARAFTGSRAVHFVRSGSNLFHLKCNAENARVSDGIHETSRKDSGQMIHHPLRSSAIARSMFAYTAVRMIVSIPICKLLTVRILFPRSWNEKLRMWQECELISFYTYDEKKNLASFFYRHVSIALYNLLFGTRGSRQQWFFDLSLR